MAQKGLLDPLSLVTPQNVRTLYQALAEDLGCEPPKLIWNDRRWRGGYQPWDRSVRMGPHTARWSTVIHEFAHHIQELVGEAKPHGPVFREALYLVSYMTLGDAARYPWRREYPQIRRWAEKGWPKMKKGGR